MKCRSENIVFSIGRRREGFSLPEVVAALVILALVSTSVLVVINRSVVSTADLALRMQAFEVARDNMEKLLALDAVQEKTEYGSSEKYPDIEWQTVIETFSQPVTSKMWVRAVCSAQYFDTAGETRTVEFIHWLTGLTEEQVQEMQDLREMERQLLIEAEQLVATIEEAAEYAGVDAQMIQAWDRGGMPKTADGSYIKIYLELYVDYGGDPPPEARQEADLAYKTLTGRDVAQVKPSPLETESVEPGEAEQEGEGPERVEPGPETEPNWTQILKELGV